MKWKRYPALCVLAAACAVTACGASFQASESTVYITKKGTVISAAIEDFNEEYYDEEELGSYITDSVDSYVAANGNGSVELDRFQTESTDAGTVAQLYLNYASYIDYAQFNDVTLYTGTIQNAQEEGYAFDRKFQEAQEGKLTGSLDAQEFMEEENLKVAVIGQEINVKVEGKIRYVSEGDADLTGEDTVRTHYDIEDPDAELTYIIYE